MKVSATALVAAAPGWRVPAFRLVVAAVWIAVSGCATLPGLFATSNAEFELEGRAAIRYGNEGGSTRIAWRHGRDADDLLISGPLGQGIANIARRGSEYLLTTADGRDFRAADAESLTESVLGWRLPLRGLPDWVRGHATPGQPADIERDGTGRPSTISQDAWRIAYLAWDGELPSRLTLTHEGGVGRVEIRLVIDRWQMASP